MPVDLPLECSCGLVSGALRGATSGNSRRLSCMCDDCQAYAHYLGRADDMLDVHGGTDLSYATQSRVSIARGRTQLRCIRITGHGVLRWYVGCCNTPVAHTPPNKRAAFVGIPHLFVNHRGVGHGRDDVFGPLTRRYQGRFATGELPKGAHLGTPLLAILKAYPGIGWDTLRGRSTPSPFIDEQTGNTVVAPQFLAPTEREQLRVRCGLD